MVTMQILQLYCSFAVAVAVAVDMIVITSQSINLQISWKYFYQW